MADSIQSADALPGEENEGMPSKMEYAPHPEELSRRISQIDLSNSRRRSDTSSPSSGHNNPRYARHDIIAVNSETPDHFDVEVPPPTPNDLPISPPDEDQINVPSNDLLNGVTSSSSRGAPSPKSLPPTGSSHQGNSRRDAPRGDATNNDASQEVPAIPSNMANVRNAASREVDGQSSFVNKANTAANANNLDCNAPHLPPISEVTLIKETRSMASRLTGVEMPLTTKQKVAANQKTKTKKPNPTGYEEFYADPPITPKEYDEESDLYDPARSVHERVQTAVQKYRQRRNLDSVRANILTKYFTLGGIESSATKQFTGGLDQKTLDEATAEEIAALRATDHIRVGHKNLKYYDPSEPNKWVVDIVGVVKGFLSSMAPRRFPLGSEAEIFQVCNVIRNFLNYLLSHGVIQEYTKEVMEAREICTLAEKELSSLAQLRRILPGDFNIACSILFGGHYQGIQAEKMDWAKDDTAYQKPTTRDQNITKSDAATIFNAGVAFAGDQALFQKVLDTDVKLVDTRGRRRALEVVAVEHASAVAMDQYKKTPACKASWKPLGLVYVKDWEGSQTYMEDNSDDEEDDIEKFIDSEKMAGIVETLGWTPAQARQALIATCGDVELACDWLLENRDTPVIHATELNDADSGNKIESFWLEDEILYHVFPGMKIELVERELNVGIKYFDKLSGLFCSFYTLLPNENIINNWKDPVSNTRPAPSVNDPQAEEASAGNEFNNELDADEKNFNFGKKPDIVIGATASTKPIDDAAAPMPSGDSTPGVSPKLIDGGDVVNTVSL